MPAFFAAVASSRLRSWSILYWLEKEPAAARVVPRAEKKMLGLGVRVERLVDQEFESSEVMALSFEESARGGRRERVVIWLVRGWLSRAWSMWLPWEKALEGGNAIGLGN